jgi:hypothetical protein
MRSKIKRRFRSIKRQSVFAPVENARTQRLATKLAQTAEQQTNYSLINSEESQEQQHKTDLTSGSLCYEILGLIDPEIIDSTNIEGLMSVMSGVFGDSF